MAKQVRKSDSAAAGERLQQARIAIQSHNATEAERIAREVLAQSPEHADALHILGVALVTLKRAREAVAPLQASARNRADPLVETDLATALRDVGRTAEALAALQLAVSREPPFPRAFHDLAVQLCTAQRFDEAELIMRRGLELAPAEPDMCVVLGGIYLSRADPANAKIAFARALANAPRHLRALHGFGTALLFEGDFEQAAQRFRRVLSFEPAHPRAGLDLGHCLLELGQWEDAIACLRAIVTVAPQQYGNALRTLIAAGRGRFWLRRSQAAAFLSSGTR